MPYQHKREPLNTDETSALTSACRTPEEKLVVWSLLDTGLRVSELSDVSKDSIDYQNHRVTVMGKGGIHGRRSKRRILKLTPRLQALLEPYLLTNDTFMMSERKIQRIVKKVATRARIRRATSPHVLRHTFAVQAIQKGISLPTLMHWLGHSNLQTTAIYLNLAPEEALKEFDEKW